MKESYKEQLATDCGHKAYAGCGDAPGVVSSFAKATAEQVGKWRRRPAIDLRNQYSRRRVSPWIVAPSTC